MIILVMGVSGAGKTTVGERLAARLGFRFIDADAHHPRQNIAKMAAGCPLDDADRGPWLEALNALLREETDAVLACSALKQRYREILARGIDDFRVVFLTGDAALIGRRLAQRKHPYMPASLLGSQLAALEPPKKAIEVDVAGNDPDRCISRIVEALLGSAP
jgi:gluconokinase